MTTLLPPDALLSRSADILATEVDDALLMLNIARGEYHGLNEVGARIWALLEQPTSSAALVTALTAEYEVTPDECAAAVNDFLSQLLERNVLTIAAA